MQIASPWQTAILPDLPGTIPVSSSSSLPMIGNPFMPVFMDSGKKKMRGKKYSKIQS
jgi:hypothetical protein